MSKFLKRCLAELIEEYKSKPYEYWKSFQFSSCFEKKFEGKLVQVEIHLLEDTNDYLNISISIDRGFWLISFFPYSSNFIVRKKSGDSRVG